MTVCIFVCICRLDILSSWTALYVCVCVLIIDTLPFSLFLSLSHAGLQLYPGCHGDSAQHWSGYFVYPLFYLKTAPLSESAYLCYNNYKFIWVLRPICCPFVFLAGGLQPAEGRLGPRRAPPYFGLKVANPGWPRLSLVQSSWKRCSSA